MYVIKKDCTSQEFDINKVITAVSKSADRCMYNFSDDELKTICNDVEYKAKEYYKKKENCTGIPISKMHSIVESVLESISPEVAKSYKDYRFGITVRVLDSCLNDKKYKIIIVHDMSYYNIKICLDEEYTDQLLMETMLSLFNPYKSFRIEDEDVVKDNYRYYMETRITEKMKDKNFNPSSIRCIIDDEFRMKGVKEDE